MTSTPLTVHQLPLFTAVWLKAELKVAVIMGVRWNPSRNDYYYLLDSEIRPWYTVTDFEVLT